MALSLSDIKTYIANELGRGLQTSASLDEAFSHVMERLAKQPRPVFASYAFEAIVSGTHTYSFESDMLRLLFAVMDDAPISMETEQTLEAYSNSWRSDTGTPVAVIEDKLNHQYRLYPTPDFSSGTAPGAEPLGEDYPVDYLFLFYFPDLTSTIQDFYGIPLALLSLSRDFELPGPNQDIEFSQAAQQLGDFFMTLLGH